MTTATKSPLEIAVETRRALIAAKQLEAEAEAEFQRADRRSRQAHSARIDADQTYGQARNPQTAQALATAFEVEAEAREARELATTRLGEVVWAREEAVVANRLAVDELVRAILDYEFDPESTGDKDFEAKLAAARRACETEASAKEDLGWAEEEHRQTSEAKRKAEKHCQATSLARNDAINRLVVACLNQEPAAAGS